MALGTILGAAFPIGAATVYQYWVGGVACNAAAGFADRFTRGEPGISNLNSDGVVRNVWCPLQKSWSSIRTASPAWGSSVDVYDRTTQHPLSCYWFAADSFLSYRWSSSRWSCSAWGGCTDLTTVWAGGPARLNWNDPFLFPYDNSWSNVGLRCYLPPTQPGQDNNWLIGYRFTHYTP
jgi:hypothetical protein